MASPSKHCLLIHMTVYSLVCLVVNTTPTPPSKITSPESNVLRHSWKGHVHPFPSDSLVSSVEEGEIQASPSSLLFYLYPSSSSLVLDLNQQEKQDISRDRPSSSSLPLSESSSLSGSASLVDYPLMKQQVMDRIFSSMRLVSFLPLTVLVCLCRLNYLFVGNTQHLFIDDVVEDAGVFLGCIIPLVFFMISSASLTCLSLTLNP